MCAFLTITLIITKALYTKFSLQLKLSLDEKLRTQTCCRQNIKCSKTIIALLSFVLLFLSCRVIGIFYTSLICVS